MVRFTILIVVLLVRCHAPLVGAQETGTRFPHPADTRWWLSGRANFIFQWHGTFTSRYESAHSLRPISEDARSRVLTLYTGLRVTPRTGLIFDLESARGRGISDAFGLAGCTNLDVVRNPTLGSAPYVARLFVHHAIALSDEKIAVDRGPLSLASEVPAKRIELRAGKFGTADCFDLNAVGGDSHLQFTNWTVDNNGGYDAAADTRGYSIGVEAEYQDRDWAVRFAEMLMPRVANGIDHDWNVAKARAENLELEVRHGLLAGRPGTVRLLGYLNHANMGSYAEAIDAWRAGIDPGPTIENHREAGRTKPGVGVNVEQTVADGVRVFGRWGWNEGRHESFAYAEENRAFVGGDVRGVRWSRGNDTLGVAFCVNALSDDHPEHLAGGGLGFLLGDDRLTYGTERIVETCHTARLHAGVVASADLQWIVNPGYNEDRGPVLVPGLRLHLEF